MAFTCHSWRFHVPHSFCIFSPFHIGDSYTNFPTAHSVLQFEFSKISITTSKNSFLEWNHEFCFIVQPTVDLLNQLSNVFQTKSNFYEFYELADDALRIVGWFVSTVWWNQSKTVKIFPALWHTCSYRRHSGNRPHFRRFSFCFILIEVTSAKKRGKINFRAVGTRQQRPRPQLGNCRLGGENKKSRNDNEIILKLIITPSSSRLKLVFYANFPVEVDFFAVKIFIEAITLRHNLKGIIWKFPVRLWPGRSHKLWAA